MDRVRLYIKESYNELVNKVTWPKWASLQQSTVVVIVATLIIALVIWMMDTAASFVLKQIYGLG